MKPILLILSTVIALSIMPGCIEDEDNQTDVYSDITNPIEIKKQSSFVKRNIMPDRDIKKRKPSSRSENKQAPDKPRSLWTEYQVIAENNLFRPLGWRKEIVKKTTPTKTVVVEIPRERPAPTYNLSLTGIAQNGSEWIAILEDETLKEGYFLHCGDKLKDSLVSEIFEEHIVLVVGDAKAQFSLGESIQYNTNGQLLLNTIANQSTLPSLLTPNSGEDAQKSLIERMKARRRKELSQE